MKIAFHTLGCKVNQYETEAIKEKFILKKHEIVGETDFADAYIINTCTVTHLADRKSRQYIRKMKRKNPNSVVLVTGCYAQVSPDEVGQIEGVNLVVGNNEKSHIVSYVEDYVAQSSKESEFHITSADQLTDFKSMGILTWKNNKTRAYIKIQEGCNRFCSYCIIPYARGKVRSRDFQEIIEEAKGFLESGTKEIVLTGINTALFNYNGDEKLGLEELISQINDLPYNFRIRLSSLEPTVINSKQARALLKYHKLCPHLHLSIQSGSNKVLALMNRNYTRDEYLDIIKVLKDHDPYYGITTDIIVGFNGEEEADFKDSLNIVEEVNFCKVHPFKFSKRKGTAAYEMRDNVSEPTKTMRMNQLMEKAKEYSDQFLMANIGSVREVLVEEKVGNFHTGYTDNYIKVYFEDSRDIINQFQMIRLEELYLDGMKGKISNG